MIRLAISADCHVMEPLDLWTEHLPPSLRARGPRVEARDKYACFMVENEVIRKFRVHAEGKPVNAPPKGESTDADPMWMGERDPDARLRDHDKDGVWGEVIYPNIAFFCCYQIRDVALAILLHMTDQNLREYGFPSAQPYGETAFQEGALGFADPAAREAALRKWARWRADHPDS